MKLVSAVSHAGGQVNEDAWGMVGNNEDVEAAWVLHGVTGINTHNYLLGQTDAAWFVEHAHAHLLRLTAENHSLDKILANLVDLLIEDWRLASTQFDFRLDYDPPATCLLILNTISAAVGEDGPRALEALSGIATARSAELKAGLAAINAKKKN